MDIVVRMYLMQDYWTHWETFKILTETTRHPEYLLVASNIEDYKFLDMAEWLKYVNTELYFDHSIDQIYTATVTCLSQCLCELIHHC